MSLVYLPTLRCEFKAANAIYRECVLSQSMLRAGLLLISKASKATAIGIVIYFIHRKYQHSHYRNIHLLLESYKFVGLYAYVVRIGTTLALSCYHSLAWCGVAAATPNPPRQKYFLPKHNLNLDTSTLTTPPSLVRRGHQPDRVK